MNGIKGSPNARPWMAGPGFDSRLQLRHGWRSTMRLSVDPAGTIAAPVGDVVRHPA